MLKPLVRYTHSRYCVGGSILPSAVNLGPELAVGGGALASWAKAATARMTALEARAASVMCVFMGGEYERTGTRQRDHWLHRSRTWLQGACRASGWRLKCRHEYGCGASGWHR